jgi:hypothetical protein
MIVSALNGPLRHFSRHRSAMAIQSACHANVFTMMSTSLDIENSLEYPSDRIGRIDACTRFASTERTVACKYSSIRCVDAAFPIRRTHAAIAAVVFHLISSSAAVRSHSPDRNRLCARGWWAPRPAVRIHDEARTLNAIARSAIASSSAGRRAAPCKPRPIQLRLHLSMRESAEFWRMMPAHSAIES